MEKKTIHDFAGNDSVSGLTKKAEDYLELLFANRPPIHTVFTHMLMRYTSNSIFTGQMVVEMLLKDHPIYFRAKIADQDIIGVKAYEHSIRKFMESDPNKKETYEKTI